MPAQHREPSSLHHFPTHVGKVSGQYESMMRATNITKNTNQMKRARARPELRPSCRFRCWSKTSPAPRDLTTTTSCMGISKSWSDQAAVRRRSLLTRVACSSIFSTSRPSSEPSASRSTLTTPCASNVSKHCIKPQTNLQNSSLPEQRRSTKSYAKPTMAERMMAWQKASKTWQVIWAHPGKVSSFPSAFQMPSTAMAMDTRKAQRSPTMPPAKLRQQMAKASNTMAVANSHNELANTTVKQDLHMISNTINTSHLNGKSPSVNTQLSSDSKVSGFKPYFM
mmetsp:Transcript_165631/g.531682  ORF Transcript_165631/g.531682 Transcript_165631/m.531682 type:complete len:281 (-) Transcript_165631:232-1074(-)